MSGRIGIAHYNNLQSVGGLSGEINTQSIKAEFARRLQEVMIRKGWNQSELARRASEYLPKPEKGQKRGFGIGRDSISHYMRGKMLPLPLYLDAIAKALGERPEDLMPTNVPTLQGVTPFEMRGMPDGRVCLRINWITVRQDAAMKILAILADEDRNR